MSFFKSVLFVIILFILPVYFSSCKKPYKNNITKEDTLYSKIISIPNNLYLFEGNNLKNADSIIKVIKDKIKVISIVDGNCIKCVIDQINRVDSIFKKILPYDAYMVFILNVKREDSAYFIYNYSPEINVSGVILWDNNYNFERYNRLFTPDIHKRTFMVDKNNRIIEYGNPAINSKIIYRYLEKLKDL